MLFWSLFRWVCISIVKTFDTMVEQFKDTDNTQTNTKSQQSTNVAYKFNKWDLKLNVPFDLSVKWVSQKNFDFGNIFRSIFLKESKKFGMIFVCMSELQIGFAITLLEVQIKKWFEFLAIHFSFVMLFKCFSFGGIFTNLINLFCNQTNIAVKFESLGMRIHQLTQDKIIVLNFTPW